MQAFDRTLRAQDFPIGIDAEDFAQMAVSAEAVRASQRLSRSLLGRKLIIGVDRLDYSKGIPERLRAYETLLQNYPAQRRQVTFVQISAPSREDVPEYAEIRSQVEATAGRINGRFGEFDWVPLRYINRGFTRRTLAGFFRLSRVGLVTPLRDGMNLVAKEYVAAQSEDDPGVLVLSRFAGAADELDGAIIVNPYDLEAVAEAMHLGLTMPLEERQDRWRRLLAQVKEHDVVQLAAPIRRGPGAGAGAGARGASIVRRSCRAPSRALLEPHSRSPGWNRGWDRRPNLHNGEPQCKGTLFLGNLGVCGLSSGPACDAANSGALRAERSEPSAPYHVRRAVRGSRRLARLVRHCRKLRGRDYADAQELDPADSQVQFRRCLAARSYGAMRELHRASNQCSGPRLVTQRTCSKGSAARQVSPRQAPNVTEARVLWRCRARSRKPSLSGRSLRVAPEFDNIYYVK